MSKRSENLHAEISKIALENKCSFVDAVLEFCEQNQLDPEDVVKQMDTVTLERLKKSAIDERLIQKKIIKTHSQELPME